MVGHLNSFAARRSRQAPFGVMRWPVAPNFAPVYINAAVLRSAAFFDGRKDIFEPLGFPRQRFGLEGPWRSFSPRLTRTAKTVTRASSPTKDEIWIAFSCSFATAKANGI
jgi:hypothetical protein